jgi:hypothetical protein
MSMIVIVIIVIVIVILIIVIVIVIVIVSDIVSETESDILIVPVWTDRHTVLRRPPRTRRALSVIPNIGIAHYRH